MSDTITDFAKVTQMLDAGWIVQIRKNGIGSYDAIGRHENRRIVANAKAKIIESTPEESKLLMIDMLGSTEQEIDTDDFTPEQALTRLAYKVQGEII